jgi:hypothetical protein
VLAALGAWWLLEVDAARHRHAVDNALALGVPAQHVRQRRGGPAAGAAIRQRADRPGRAVKSSTCVQFAEKVPGDGRSARTGRWQGLARLRRRDGALRR